MPRTRTALILFVVLLAGCSSGGGDKVSAGSSTSTTTAAASSGAGGQADFSAYTACLKDHGVDLPAGRGGFGGGRPGGTATGTPGGGQGRPAQGQRTPPSLPAGVTQAQLQAAQDACADKRPAGGFGGGGGAAGSTAFQAYASCLADHGVTVTTASTVEGQAARPGIDRSDPDFVKANQTCSALLPQPGSPSTTTAS